MLVWFVFMAVAVKNNGETCQSRLGEMKQGARLSFWHERSPGRLAQPLSEQATRPGERDLA